MSPPLESESVSVSLADVNPAIAFARESVGAVPVSAPFATVTVVVADSFPLSPTAFTIHVPFVSGNDAFVPVVTAESDCATTVFRAVPVPLVAMMRALPL